MSGSLATEQAILQATANTYAPLDNLVAGTITLADGDLFPGSGGSVTDPAGNVLTLPLMDGNPNFGQVTLNGTPVPDGNYTAAAAVSGGQFFLEDGKLGNVYNLDPTTGQFTLVGGAMPASDVGDTSGNSSNVPSNNGVLGVNVVDTGGGDNNSTNVAGGAGANTGIVGGVSSVNTVTPGNGSFTGPTPDGTVGTYSINPNGDVADLNGQPLTPDGGSSGTGVLQLTADQMVVGQDESSGNWFLLASKGTPGLFEWQPTGAPTGASASATVPAASSSASMQFIAPNTSVATTDFTQSCSHG